MDLRDPSGRATGPALRLTTPTDTARIAWLRRRVREYLDHHGSHPDVVDDLELAVSELSTNVIHHTDSDVLSVRLACVDGDWILDVADAEDLPALEDIALPAPSAPDGRGLFIAAAVMDEMTLTEVDGKYVVRCRRSAPN